VRPAVPYGSLYIRNEPSTGTLTAKPPTWYLQEIFAQDQYSGCWNSGTVRGPRAGSTDRLFRRFDICGGSWSPFFAVAIEVDGADGASDLCRVSGLGSAAGSLAVVRACQAQPMADPLRPGTGGKHEPTIAETGRDVRDRTYTPLSTQWHLRKPGDSLTRWLPGLEIQAAAACTDSSQRDESTAGGLYVGKNLVFQNSW